MPAPGQIAPGSLAGRIRDHLAHADSALRARDVAEALPPPEDDLPPEKWRQRINNELNRMAKRGTVHRERGVVTGRGAGGAVYSLPQEG